ncbi:MAG: IPT/TIG domain-containing protein [Ferruginibacter sp.]
MSLESISRICRFIFLSLFIIFLFSSCKKTNINEVSGPVITSISPSGGMPGTVVTLTGNYFGGSLSQNKVSFDWQETVISSASKTQLVVVAPQHLPGTAAIRVTVNGKESMSVNFEFQ